MIQLNYIFVHHSISTLYYIYVFNMFSIQIIWKPFDNTVLKNAKNVYLFTSYTFKKLCLDYSNKPPFCGNVSKSNCGQFFLVSDCLASLCIMLYFSRSYSLIFILYDRLIIPFNKMAHKSKPLSLKQWIEAIIFRMQGQFLKKFNNIVIPNILVMVSDQEICTIIFAWLLQGDWWFDGSYLSQYRL